MEWSVTGYRGKVRSLLDRTGVNIGDSVVIRKAERVFRGVLMPRPELADDRHVVIKLPNGYNIGVRIGAEVSIGPQEAGEKK
jgi:glutamyl-tRNA(Gln) amidotransferase subunit D